MACRRSAVRSRLAPPNLPIKSRPGVYDANNFWDFSPSKGTNQGTKLRGLRPVGAGLSKTYDPMSFFKKPIK